MTTTEQPQATVTSFPLVGPSTSDVAGLVAIIRRLTIARTLSEIMEITTHAARTLLKADGITFVLREGDLCYYAEEDAVSPLWKGHRFPMSACISGWCMTEAKSAVIPDIYKDPRIPHAAYRPTFVRSLAMVPVRQEAPIAAMGAYWARTRETTAAELELLQTIGNSASLAIALVQNRQRQVPARGQVSRAALTQAEPERGDQEIIRSIAKRWIASGLRPNSPPAYAFAILCVGVATMVRMALGSAIGADITPFATYYPAVLITALIGGAGAAALALVLGALCAWWAFVPHYHNFHLGTVSDAVSLGLYGFSSALIVWIADGYRRGFFALLNQEGRRQLLMGELQHRMRNTLAVVQAIISQSLRDQPEQVQKIGSRIAAVAAGSNVELSGPPDLKSVLLAALQPYRSERIVTQGEDLELEHEVARILALTFHELATNAAKYGSLSVPHGSLSVSWKIADGRILVTWIEREGPAVVPPKKRGFGTTFIGRLLDSVGGKIDTDFRPNGLEISIDLPNST